MKSPSNSHSAGVVEKLVWWATPPAPGETDADINWGYLVIKSDHSFEFVPTRPSADEIANRTHCLLPSG